MNDEFENYTTPKNRNDIELLLQKLKSELKILEQIGVSNGKPLPPEKLNRIYAAIEGIKKHLRELPAPDEGKAN